jgi:hypothetical protein
VVLKNNDLGNHRHRIVAATTISAATTWRMSATMGSRIAMQTQLRS